MSTGRHLALNHTARVFCVTAFLLSSFFLLRTSLAFAAVNTTVIGPSTLYSGIIGWWTFDGQDTNWTTGIIKDKTGNGHDGTMSNFSTSTTGIEGIMGQGFSYTGGSPTQKITIANPTSLPFSSAMTVSYWSLLPTPTASIYSSISIGTSTTNEAGCFYNGAWLCYPGINVNVSSGASTAGIWEFITFTYDGSNMRIYKNGVLKAGPTAATAWGGSPTFAYIGIYKDGSSFPMKGMMDDVRIYNRALSAQEVADLYNLGTAGKVNAPQVGAQGKSGLLAWYTFDGTNVMNTIADSSGNGNTATPNNFNATSTTLSAGKAGQAVTFDSTQSRYIMTPLTGPIGTASYSYSVWFKTSTTQLAGLISQRDSSGSPQFSLNISNAGIGGPGNLVSIVDNDGTLARSGVSSQSYTDGKWHFATVVRDTNTSTTLCYIDGALAITSNATAIPNLGGTNNIMIGAAGDGGTFANFHFTGSLDDARIYNKALSAQEVLEIYKATGGGKVNNSSVGPGNLNSGLVGWWTFDGADTNWRTGITNDKSGPPAGGGNNGQLISMSTTTSPVMGKVGQGLKFDGSTACVSGGNASSLNITGALTLAAWIYPRSSSNNRTIIARSQVNGSSDQYVLQDIGSNRYAMVLGPPPNGSPRVNAFTGSGHVPLNKWSHLVGTYDGAGNTAIYVNGALDSSTASSTVSTLNTASVQGVTIGDAGDNGFLCSGTASYHFDGFIDDARIYNRALSAQEVQQLYLMGK